MSVLKKHPFQFKKENVKKKDKFYPLARYYRKDF